MSVVVAFNTLLAQFITELSETFPNDKKLFIYKTIIHEMCQGEATVGIETFRDKLSQFASQIVSRDETMFATCQPLFGRVDLGEIWKTHDFTDANKDVFWEYMHAMLDMCLQAFPSAAPASALPENLDLSTLTLPENFDLSALTLPENFDLSTLPANLASMMPAPMMEAAKEMLQGVDMNDVLSLAKDLDENDVRDVLGSIDPSVLASLSTGNFSADTLTRLQQSIQPERLLEIVGKFDKTKLAKLASQVDQSKLMDLAAPLKKKKTKSQRK